MLCLTKNTMLPDPSWGQHNFIADIHPVLSFKTSDDSAQSPSICLPEQWKKKSLAMCPNNFSLINCKVPSNNTLYQNEYFNEIKNVWILLWPYKMKEQVEASCIV